jgi:hypothetical protein
LFAVDLRYDRASLDCSEAHGMVFGVRDVTDL